jgi:alpha-N-arabinofuranosidase
MVGFQKLSVLFVAVLAAIVEAGPSKPKPGKPAPPKELKLSISTKGGGRNKTAPLLHGLFFEDINVNIKSLSQCN